jgi:UDP-glucose 4-epimerase
MKLGWRPELDDLPTMIEHAHNWERKLIAATTATPAAYQERAVVVGR